MKNGDVVLSVEEVVVKNVKDFMKILKEKNQQTTLNLGIMRNQAEQAIVINTK